MSCQIPSPFSLIFLVRCLCQVLMSRLCQLHKRILQSHTLCPERVLVKPMFTLLYSSEKNKQKQQQNVEVTFHWNLWTALLTYMIVSIPFLFRLLTYYYNHLIKMFVKWQQMKSHEPTSLLTYICFAILLHYFYSVLAYVKPRFMSSFRLLILVIFCHCHFYS